MKAISLWQPWASLIACGAKQYETRSWAPPRELIGQTIAIHSAKKIDKDAAEFAEELMYGQHHPGAFDLADKLAATMRDTPDSLMGAFGMAAMPIGCVVATARLDAAFLCGEHFPGTNGEGAKVARRMISRPMPDCFNVRVDEFGDYSPGRWAWLLRNVQAITPPAAARGAQGFFELPQGWMVGEA